MQTRLNHTDMPLTFLLVVVWGVMIVRLNVPWFGAQDSTRLWLGSAILNIDRYGVQNTKFMMVRNVTPTTPDHLEFYSHHPPLSFWIPVITTRLFGFGEWSVRYASIVLTLISVAALYALARALYGRQLARWAAFFFACTPMILYMGRVPGHDGLVPALVFAVVFVNWLKKPNRLRYGLLIAIVWWCAWTAWASLFYVAFLGLAGMWLGSPAQRRQIVILGAAASLAVVTLLVFYQLQWDQSIQSLLDAFVWRTSSASGRRDSVSFTMLDFFGKMFLHIAVFISLGLLILSVWGVPVLVQRGARASNILLLGLFAGGMAYQLVFRNASYIHEYYKSFLVPSMAIAAAAAYVHVRFDPEIRWFLRPVVDGLLVSVVIPTLFVVLVLHLSGNRDDLQMIIDIIHTRAGPETMIASNLTRSEDTSSVMPIEYYTYRALRWGISPEQAVGLAAESDLFYFFCGEPTDELSTLQNQYAYQVIDEDTCWFFDFGGED